MCLFQAKFYLMFFVTGDSNITNHRRSRNDNSGASGFRKKWIKIRNASDIFPTSISDYKPPEKLWSSRCREKVIGVLTTISNPTDAIIKLCIAKTSAFPIIVIADRKGPSDWSSHHLCDGVEYISVEKQIQLAQQSSSLGKFISQVPWNHFGRKNIGYLLAVMRGACAIWDFDDDNVLLSSELQKSIFRATSSIGGELFGMRIPNPSSISTLINPYPLLAPSRWFYPRGIPLERIHDEAMMSGELVRLRDSVRSSIAVIQSSAAISPDVDAVYRLTNSAHRFQFQSYIPLVTLVPPATSPYNAQATVHLSNALWATFLPMTVHGRVSDIWRSYISQAIFHVVDLTVSFAPAWVQHIRSPHDLIRDLNAEDEIYQSAESLTLFLSKWSKEVRESRGGVCVPQLLSELYRELYEYDVVQEQDLSSISLWISALVENGMTFPCVASSSSSAPGPLSSLVISPARPGRFERVHKDV